MDQFIKVGSKKKQVLKQEGEKKENFTGIGS